jgi:hypothetical protein
VPVKRTIFFFIKENKHSYEILHSQMKKFCKAEQDCFGALGTGRDLLKMRI